MKCYSKLRSNLRFFFIIQDCVTKEELSNALTLEFVNRVNEVGVDVNRALDYPHTAPLLQFVCGLGPRKGTHLLKVRTWQSCISKYSCPRLTRPPFLQWKNGLVYSNLISIILSQCISGLIRGVAFDERDLKRRGLLYIQTVWGNVMEKTLLSSDWWCNG